SAVVHDALKNIAELWIAFRFAMPFCQYRGRHFDIAAQHFRGMAAQKQPVKERSLALRILQIRWLYCRNELYCRRHGESAVYRKAFPRQVVLQVSRYLRVNSPRTQCN